LRKRRFEILLPLLPSDERPISPEKLSQTRDELVARFGSISLFPHTLLSDGLSPPRHELGELRRLSVEVDDVPENRQFFTAFKATLLERFEQLELDMVSAVIDRL
jgi:hypothetical protein